MIPFMRLNRLSLKLSKVHPHLRRTFALVDELGEDPWAQAYPRAPQHQLSSITLSPSILKELKDVSEVWRI